MISPRPSEVSRVPPYCHHRGETTRKCRRMMEPSRCPQRRQASKALIILPDGLASYQCTAQRASTVLFLAQSENSRSQKKKLASPAVRYSYCISCMYVLGTTNSAANVP